MRKKGWYLFLVIFLWIGLFVLIAAILYLSLQNGTEAKEQMYKIIHYVARYIDIEVPEQGKEMDKLIYVIRQAGRAGAFFLLGAIATLAVHISFRRANRLVKLCITAIFPVVIAYFTEKVKVYLPTRHYSEEEMLLSIAAAILGFLFVSAVVLIVWIVKGFVRLVAPRE